MSGITELYNFNFSSPAAIDREPYYNVGASTFNLGVIRRGFKGGTDFEIWDSPAAGTQLTEGVDYDLSDIDFDLSLKAGYNVFTKIQVTNVTYQSGFIYITGEVVGSYTDANAKRNWDYVIYDQASFINAFYRSAANIYKIKDDITSIFWKLGNRLVADLFTDGDLFGDIDTNNCLTIQAENGAEIDFDDHDGSFLITGDKVSITNLTGKGDNSTSISDVIFKLSGNDITLTNLVAKERVGGVGFQHSDGSWETFRMALIGCKGHDLGSGFSKIKNATSCNSEDNSVYGFVNCLFVDSSCWAENNTGANFLSTAYGAVDGNCTSGCLEDGTLLFSKSITGSITNGNLTANINHGISNADTNSRIELNTINVISGGGETYQVSDDGGAPGYSPKRTLYDNTALIVARANSVGTYNLFFFIIYR